MAKSCKTESGAQLLARLGPRPSLQGLSPLLGPEPSSGEIIELYGPEGVGKTELLLHLVTRTILPARWHHCHLHGDQAQVVWVDTDLKFSVLRLAVLLERHILNAVQKRENGYADNAPKSDGDGEGDDSSKHKSLGPLSAQADKLGLTLSQSSCACKNHTVKNTDCTGDRSDQTKTFPDNESVSHGVSDHNSGRSDRNTGSENVSYGQSKPASGKEEKSTFEYLAEDMHDEIQSDACSVQGGRQLIVVEGGKQDCNRRKNCLHLQHEADCDTSHQPDSNRNSINPFNPAAPFTLQSGGCSRAEWVKEKITSEEIETLVQECLDRLHVVHCTSSQQLICTLHSLDATIAANKNISLLIIDSVSSFFWSDKCRDHDHSSSYLHKTMSHITAVLKKISATYGVTVVATKQALIKRKQRDEDSCERTVCSSLSGSNAGSEGHVEFLGKSWSDLVTKRLICTKGAAGKFGLLGAKGQQYFRVDEHGVHFSV